MRTGRPVKEGTECVVFGGAKYYRAPDAKDWASSHYFKAQGPVRLLHREVWKSVHGDIPKGMIIHLAWQTAQNKKAALADGLPVSSPITG